MDCERKLLLAEYMLKWARSLVEDAVRLMSPEQVGRWAGVRAWQESVPSGDGDDAEYRTLAALLESDDAWRAFVAYREARPVYWRIRQRLFEEHENGEDSGNEGHA